MEHPFPIGTRVRITNFLSGKTWCGEVERNAQVVSEQRGWYEVRTDDSGLMDALAYVTEVVAAA